MHIAPGTIFATDFRLLERIGAGGMGSVYVAEQLSTGRRRALKVMLPQIVQDSDLRRRFEQEARIGSRIESEHVVEVVAAGIEEDTPWLAMELLVGEDLGATLARRGPLEWPEVREILEQACHALGAAHAAGIVHRDLKPENIFLAESKRATESRVVKVLDFGIAKIVAEAATRHTAAVGSPSWMAPEQSERGGVTPAADVWSLALITFTLLTGRSFWLTSQTPGATIQQVMRETIFEPIPKASERARAIGVDPARLPPWFDDWFGACLERDPKVRTPNAAEAWRALAATSSTVMQAPTPPPLPAVLTHAPTVLAAPPVFSTQTALAKESSSPPSRAPIVVAAALGACTLAAALGLLVHHLRKANASSDPPAPTVSAPVVAPEPSAMETAPPLPQPAKPLVPVPSNPIDRVAANQAANGVDVQSCKSAGGPTGAAVVTLTFLPNGTVHAAFKEAKTPFTDTPTGKCILDRYRALHIAAFEGKPFKTERNAVVR